MPALAHAIVHVALCPAMARLPQQTQLPIRVRLAYPRNGFEVDKTYVVERGTGPTADIEFDAAAGTYRLTLDAPKYGCSASAYVAFLADRPRTIAETLHAGPRTPPPPVALLSGTAPPSFAYVRPTFVVLPGTASCGKPVPDAIRSDIAVENELGAFYVTLPLDPAVALSEVPEPAVRSTTIPVSQRANPAAAPSADLRPTAPAEATAAAGSATGVGSLRPGQDIVALRLRSATGLYHFVRLVFEYPPPWGGWPDNVTFNVSADQLADMATEQPDTLLCPHLYITTVHT